MVHATPLWISFVRKAKRRKVQKWLNSETPVRSAFYHPFSFLESLNPGASHGEKTKMEIQTFDLVMLRCSLLRIPLICSHPLYFTNYWTPKWGCEAATKVQNNSEATQGRHKPRCNVMRSRLKFQAPAERLGSDCGTVGADGPVMDLESKQVTRWHLRDF